jgi:hypothetical protein
MSTTQPETRTHVEIEDAEREIEAHGLSPHWRLSVTSGTAADPVAYWRLERAAGGKQEAIHRDLATVIRLAQDVDRRLPLAQPVAVSEGQASSVSY